MRRPVQHGVGASALSPNSDTSSQTVSLSRDATKRNRPHHAPEVRAEWSCVRIRSQDPRPGRTMVTPLEPVRAITIEEIEKARERIARTVVRTPLLRLDTGRSGPE